MGSISGVILILLICCYLTEVEGAECSPILDKFIRKGKCRYCPPCDEGRGRNFTLTAEQIEKLDKTKCLPCEKCPDGSFNDGNGFKSICRPCTNDRCYKLKRHIQMQCTSTLDQICGSCIHDYNDYFHRDYKQPCYKNPTRANTTQVLNIESPLPLKTPRQDNRGNVKGQSGDKTYDPKHLIITIVSSSVAFLLLCLLVFITYRRWKRRHGQCSDSENGVCAIACSMTTLDSSVNEKSALMEQTETDGPPQGDRKQMTVPVNGRSIVRGELQSHNGPTNNDIQDSELHTDHRAKIDEAVKKCGCSVAKCSPACKASCIDKHMVTKGDSILNLIATQICHETDQFFTALEIPHCELYNLENNRTRAPDKYSEREFIRSVLSRWVEINGKSATYDRIREALCAGDFHGINEALFPRQ